MVFDCICIDYFFSTLTRPPSGAVSYCMVVCNVSILITSLVWKPFRKTSYLNWMKWMNTNVCMYRTLAKLLAECTYDTTHLFNLLFKHLNRCGWRSERGIESIKMWIGSKQGPSQMCSEKSTTFCLEIIIVYPRFFLFFFWTPFSRSSDWKERP